MTKTIQCAYAYPTSEVATKAQTDSLASWLSDVHAGNKLGVWYLEVKTRGTVMRRVYADSKALLLYGFKQALRDYPEHSQDEWCIFKPRTY